MSKLSRKNSNKKTLIFKDTLKHIGICLHVNIHAYIYIYIYIYIHIYDMCVYCTCIYGIFVCIYTRICHTKAAEYMLYSSTHWHSPVYIICCKTASLIAKLVKNPPALKETPIQYLGWEDVLKDRLPTPVFLGFPCGSAGKEFACNAGDLASIPKLGRSPREGNGYPLQYSGLENSMDCMGSQRVRYDWETFTSFYF